MCIAEKQEGGPRRCPAGAAEKVQAAQRAVDRQQGAVDLLDTSLLELDADSQLLEDMRQALSGEMTAERERELIAGAQQHLDTIDDGDPDKDPDSDGDFEEWAAQLDDHPDPTTDDYVSMARQAWDDVQSSIQIVVTPEGTARWQNALAHYEASLGIVGQHLADDADTIADDQIRAEGVERRTVTADEYQQVRREHLDAHYAARAWSQRINAGEALSDKDLAEAAAAAERMEHARSLAEEIADDALCHGPRSRRRAEIRAAAYRDVIGKVRPLGGAAQTLSGRPKQDMRDQIAQVAADMPADWVDDASKQPLTLQRRKGKRGYYSPTESTIRTGGNIATMYHEYAHHIETRNMQIHLATNAFLARRTTDADGKPMPALKYGPRGSGERVIPDGFVDQYVGKHYSHASTEVFSMGTEAVFCGRHGGLVGDQEDGRADSEHRNLILGLWATARSDTHTED